MAKDPRQDVSPRLGLCQPEHAAVMTRRDVVAAFVAASLFGGPANAMQTRIEGIGMTLIQPSGRDFGVPVRLAEPRIPPLDYAAATAEQRAAIDGFGLPHPPLNIFSTFAQATEALEAFRPWGQYIMSAENSLPPRERELVILRVGVRCRSGYEFAQHWGIGLHAGLTPTEMDRLREDDLGGWADADAALLRACDDIVADQFVSDAAWADLLSHYSQRQAMDVVFTAAQYVQVSIMLNSFGVQIEPAMQRVGV